MAGRSAYGTRMVSRTGLVLVGRGPAATGPGRGWNMRADLFAECPVCRDLMSLAPTETESCSCGSLHKDADAGRFGCGDGDEAIAVYRRA